MNSKRELKWEVFTSRIFKSLRNGFLVAVSGFFLLAVFANSASSQTRITGTIKDASGEPLIGVSVIEKGTTNGAATDVNGAYSLSVAPNATIDATYIGFVPQTFRVTAGRSVYDLVMKEDTKSLDEVVVIGYGVQKKKLVTGSTIQVKGEELQKRSTTNVFTALQSHSPGVSIMQNNGQPGAGYIVNIRGIGTNGESRPLYVIDGVAAGNDGLNQMSAADIESIDILKDAASSAIYGARAANGVVLVTTKQGKAGKTRLFYDGYYGQQYMAKKPDLLNAKEYIMIQNERAFNTGVAPYKWNDLLPKGMYDDIMSGKWAGSDWVDAFYNKGAVDQGHSINLTGGNEMSTFSMGYSYASKDGIFGEKAQSNYTRNTFRINSDHVVLKAKDFDAIKIGETLLYTYRFQNGIQQGNMYWNDFTGVLRANPLLPIYNEKGGYYDQNDKNNNGWVFEGAATNPIADTNTSSRGLNLQKVHSLRTSAYLQIQPVKNLIFKSTFGYNMSASSNRSMSKQAYLSTNLNRPYDQVDQDQSVGYGWNLENILSYSFSHNGHNVNAQAVQSIEKWGYGESVSAGRNINNFTGLGWDYAWVNNFIPTLFSDTRNGGGPWGEGAIASFMGLVRYNFKETYMFSATLRADGSSNFARGNRWGYFPSFQAGWIVSNESFLESTKGTLDYLKLTASWGQVGNQSVAGFQYITNYEFPATALYYFGDDAKNIKSNGAVPRRLKNPDISWETQQMLDLGISTRWLNSRLGIDFNYYVKDTKGWLLDAPISGTWGIRPPTVNGGSMQNRGVEFVFSWDDYVNKDFNYSINLNGSYNRNRVTAIANTEGIIHGTAPLAQGTSELTRLWVGHPAGMFYGWKADGIFQNQAEVDAYVNKDGKPILPNAQPGDVRFRDIAGPKDANGKPTGPDGKIDENDKMEIGCGMPTTQMGLSLGVGYKGFDIGMDASGKFDFQIAKSYRSFTDSEMQNYTTTVFERWTGEGTSNKWPRLTNGNHINYQYVSDIFLEQGDFVKIQNITLGYDFKRLFPHMPFGKARFYVMGQNLFTFTGYSGMDPEIGFGDGNSWQRSIDVGYYPSSKTFMAGVQLTF